jgi:hypothetical protein
MPQVVYVLQANDAGQIVTPLPGADASMQLQRSIEWLLVDGMTVSCAFQQLEYFIMLMMQLNSPYIAPLA